MGFVELSRTIGRYAASTAAWLFVIIGPATGDTVQPVDHGQRPTVDRLDDRHGADGSDPEHDSRPPMTTPMPSPAPGG